ncbi:E6 protein [Phocoena phocoena papillomavirus 4]|uniref:Protein E6 n=1 Tax=Phocoena phocoena papillomavirus 4 TaxID=706527 RepID=F2VIS0_9PAPI|nr:E6 protein [Phocoena phocoena papillomavirus 4]ADJ96353.1 E6 protein [Phocoena phocoena papillomavirus 4]
MASEKPTPCLLEDLCSSLHLQPEDLLLTCIFCKKHLSEPDIWQFIYKNLLVVWRHGWPFGICWRCVDFQAKLERLRHYERSAYAATVEIDTGLPLSALQIRCTGCWKQLSFTEKYSHIRWNLRFHKIANNWRGFCNFCVRTDADFPCIRYRPRVRRPQPVDTSSSSASDEDGDESEESSGTETFV